MQFGGKNVFQSFTDKACFLRKVQLYDDNMGATNSYSEDA